VLQADRIARPAWAGGTGPARTAPPSLARPARKAHGVTVRPTASRMSPRRVHAAAMSPLARGPGIARDTGAAAPGVAVPPAAARGSLAGLARRTRSRGTCLGAPRVITPGTPRTARDAPANLAGPGWRLVPG
jgi:hypothetical protein